MRQVLFLAMLCLSIGASASIPELLIKKDGDIFNDFIVEMYEDKTKSLRLEEIAKLNSFTKTGNKISEGYSASHYWYRFSIKNESDKDLNYTVHFTENFADKIDYYLIAKDGSYEKHQEGVGYFVDGEVNIHKTPDFPLDLASKETKTVYIRLYSRYSNFTSFLVLDHENLEDYTSQYTTFYSIYIGAILSLLLYNLAIFFFNREFVYFSYVSFGTGFLLWQILINGIYPLDTYSSSTSFYLFGMIIPGWLALFMFFSRAILNTKQYFPKTDRFILGFGIIYIALCITTTIDLSWSFMMINAITNLTLPFVLYVAFESYFAGNKAALFYIIAQLSFMSGSILFALMTDGYIGYSLVTRHSIVAGSFVEIILFSLALAYRIRLLQDDKLALIRQTNEQLDEKVNERTEELEASKDKLLHLSNRDPLTNLYNRRYLFDISPTLISSAKKTNSSLSVMIFDIDDFKNINDNFGHIAGDKVIEAFSEILELNNKGNIVSRIGGDEFVVLLTNMKADDAYEIASKIRRQTENTSINTDEHADFNFTVSGGVVEFLNDIEKEITQAIHRADMALYLSKKLGKNIISTA